MFKETKNGGSSNFDTFKTVTTQKDQQPTCQQFKISLRTFEDNDHSSVKTETIMKVETQKESHQIICYLCKIPGHKSYKCKKNKRWCNICKTKTHDTKVCRKRKDTVNNVTEEGDVNVNYYFKIEVDPNETLDDDKMNLLVDCGAATQIVNELSKFTSFDEDFNPNEHYIELADGSRSNNVVLKKGTAIVNLQDTQGKVSHIGLKKCLYIPSYKQSIFSVPAATQKGGSVNLQVIMVFLVQKMAHNFTSRKEVDYII